MCRPVCFAGLCCGHTPGPLYFVGGCCGCTTCAIPSNSRKVSNEDIPAHCLSLVIRAEWQGWKINLLFYDISHATAREKWSSALR